MRVIALGEFIPYHILTDPIKEKLGTSSIEEGEPEQKKSVISGMGVMLVVLIFILLLAVLTISLIRFCKCSSKLYKVFLKVKTKLFWNMFLRYILTSYLKTSLSVLAALSLISFRDTKHVIDAVTSILLITVLMAIPIFFAYIL